MTEPYIHIYRCENPRRVRKQCPFHKRLEYGEQQDFYDTRRIFFDCGTFVDYGYGYWEKPKQYKKLHIWYFEDHWEVRWECGYSPLGKSKTKTGIMRLAKYHLKKGGKIKLFENNKTTIIKQDDEGRFIRK